MSLCTIRCRSMVGRLHAGLGLTSRKIFFCSCCFCGFCDSRGRVGRAIQGGLDALPRGSYGRRRLVHALGARLDVSPGHQEIQIAEAVQQVGAPTQHQLKVLKRVAAMAVDQVHEVGTRHACVARSELRLLQGLGDEGVAEAEAGGETGLGQQSLHNRVKVVLQVLKAVDEARRVALLLRVQPVAVVVLPGRHKVRQGGVHARRLRDVCQLGVPSPGVELVERVARAEDEEGADADVCACRLSRGARAVGQEGRVRLDHIGLIVAAAVDNVAAAGAAALVGIEARTVAALRHLHAFVGDVALVEDRLSGDAGGRLQNLAQPGVAVARDGGKDDLLRAARGGGGHAGACAAAGWRDNVDDCSASQGGLAHAAGSHAVLHAHLADGAEADAIDALNIFGLLLLQLQAVQAGLGQRHVAGPTGGTPELCFAVVGEAGGAEGVEQCAGGRRLGLVIISLSVVVVAVLPESAHGQRRRKEILLVATVSTVVSTVTVAAAAGTAA
eukprot:m.133614 g.133614  ORF g.133614 m.133614 type:complete len:499 (-) comp16517_c0_seq4:127-1623(-)